MLPIATQLLSISTISKMKGFEFYTSQVPIGKKENPNKSSLYSHQKKQRTSKQEALY
jgi:hypothetical protein